MGLLLQITLLLVIATGCSSKDMKPSEVDGREISLQFEEQLDKHSCGIASAVSVFNYWRDEFNTTQRELLKRYPLENIKDGYSLSQIKDIAKDFEFQAFTLQFSSIEDLKKQVKKGRPVIVQLRLDAFSWVVRNSPLFPILVEKDQRYLYHFVVVTKVTENYISYMDPTSGLEEVKVSDFQKMWIKKVVLLISS
jgi:ABC-type bacteriocin/lantibiotic exporter with double-glycine peptidase domain